MTHNCNLCNKTFPSNSKLETHKNRKVPCNAKKEPTECKICNIKCKWPADLERHNASTKHKNNYNEYIKNNKDNENESNNDDNVKIEQEQKLKKELEEMHNKKLTKELKAKDDIISKLSKENDNLKFDFNENIKIEIKNEVIELIPIFDKITNHKVLNKINMNEILTQYNKLLSITELLYIINYDLNKMYIDKFWSYIEHEECIYLDDELIQWLGYNEINNNDQLIKIIKGEFEIFEDYKILNHDEYEYIYLSIDCFKNICMLVGTNKAKDIYKYFIEVEKIYKFYLKYTAEYKNYELEKSKLIKNKYINKSNLLINSKLYLITTVAKAKENIFKFGSTINEKARKSVYNTGHIEADEFFYVAVYDCYDAISLEKYIAKLLINFKIPNESEMYQLHFNALDAIIKSAVKKSNESLNEINLFLTNEYDKYLHLEPIKF